VCQLPIVYVLDNSSAPGIVIDWQDGNREKVETSREIFNRSGKLRKLTVTIDRSSLLKIDNE
jgi:hypothetical protein